jgi:tripartite-type tricarboxylate transporter receptor subunit TctC
MPDFISTTWFAGAAPPRLSAALQSEIATAMIDVLKMADVQERFRNLSVAPDGRSPAETAAFIKNESHRWGEVIKKAGVVVD